LQLLIYGFLFESVSFFSRYTSKTAPPISNVPWIASYTSLIVS
jgi:hypothetical protein